MLAQFLTGHLTVKQAAQAAEPQHRRRPSTSPRPLLSRSDPPRSPPPPRPPGSRRRRLTGRRIAGGSVPYLLLVPVVAVLAAILGYPIYNLVGSRCRSTTLFELLQHHGEYIGLDNFGTVLHDPVFWHTLLRTVVFTVVNVGLTIVLGTLIALLLVRVSTWVRLLLTAGLVLVWAMPPVVAVQVWIWMTNSQNGVLNYVLDAAPRRQLLPARLVRDDVLVSCAMVTHAHRLGGAAVRRDHALRGALAGAARARRGGRDRRRARVAGLQGRDAAGPHADPADPDEPLDPLGLRRLHPGVPADRPGPASRRATT